MNKKTKNKLSVLRERVQKLQKQLAGARQQDDEPGEVQRLEAEIAKNNEEIEKLKNA